MTTPKTATVDDDLIRECCRAIEARRTNHGSWPDSYPAAFRRVEEIMGWTGEVSAMAFVEQYVSSRAVRVVAAAPDLLAELRKVEWSGRDWHGLPCCPQCGGVDQWRQAGNVGHRPGCTLAAALAKATGSP